MHMRENTQLATVTVINKRSRYCINIIVDVFYGRESELLEDRLWPGKDIIEQSTSGNKLKLLPLAENSGWRGMTIFPFDPEWPSSDQVLMHLKQD